MDRATRITTTKSSTGRRFTRGPVTRRLVTRRAVLQAGLMAGVGLWAHGGALRSARGAFALDPRSLDKYIDPLPIPSVLKSSKKNPSHYEVEMREVKQKLHSQLPATRVWGYNGSFPGPTIEARTLTPITVRWTNNLPATHLLPVDKTLHGAEPDVPEVRAVVHLHGGHTLPEFDGHPDDWLTSGNSRVFAYANDQPASTLWYHDHALAITRLNVYAGLAAFYILRDANEDELNLPGRKYEIPLAIQDRSFNSDGSLFYPSSRVYFDGFPGPYIPDSDVPPVWNPEFFGDTMLVNGKVWPYLDVERRRYRFRILNGCNSRFLILGLDRDLPLCQIGSDGGFLPAPVFPQSLLLAPGERADVLVDFSSVPVGTKIHLLNVGPDEPFSGLGGPPADLGTTGQVMQFRVVKKGGTDKTTPLDELQLPPYLPLGSANETRRVSLNELDSAVLEDVGPIAALLGTMEEDQPVPAWWDEPPTETPALGSTEMWEISNFTADAHPIHLHQVQFEVVSRSSFGGAARSPEPWELGRKDTVIAYPGEITAIKAHFDIPGPYVWHCHILEHEDNEMMRPLIVE